MKKVIFILIILSLRILGFGQSKQETTEWILSKFRKWKTSDTRIGYSDLGVIIGGTAEVPRELAILNCKMIFKSRYSNVLSGSSYDEIAYSFNFGDVKDIEWVHAYDNDLLIISTNGKLVKNRLFLNRNILFEVITQIQHL
jgi:hypothetical protein